MTTFVYTISYFYRISLGKEVDGYRLIITLDVDTQIYQRGLTYSRLLVS